MIHQNRSKVKIPDVLNGNSSPGKRERTRSETFYAVPENNKKSFNFQIYRDKSVKDKLNDLFHKKCAYCEAQIRGYPFPVEHFRPKGAVVHETELRKPGYYWLAAEWDNLLPSCVDCNSERYQEFADIEPILSGKANKFPIANLQKRAKKPGEEKHEIRLLFHPCRDYPERALEFDEIGTVLPAKHIRGITKQKAKTSIKVYGLNREELVKSREGLIIRLKVQIKRVFDASDDIDNNPNDKNKRIFAFELRELFRFREKTEPFQALVRNYSDKFVSAVETFIGERFVDELDASRIQDVTLTEQFIKKHHQDDQPPPQTSLGEILARHS